MDYIKALWFLAHNIPSDAADRARFGELAGDVLRAHAWVAQALAGRPMHLLLRTARRFWRSLQRQATMRRREVGSAGRVWSCACCTLDVEHLDGVLGRSPARHICQHGIQCARAEDGLPACLDCRAAYAERQRLDVASLPAVEAGEVLVLVSTGEAIRSFARAQEHGVKVSLARAGAEHVTIRAKASDLDVLTTGQRLVRVRPRRLSPAEAHT